VCVCVCVCVCVLWYDTAHHVRSARGDRGWGSQAMARLICVWGSEGTSTCVYADVFVASLTCWGRWRCAAPP
jgi:hypothetical protein